MSLPTDDHERLRLVREHLYTPVVGDILDAMGRYHCFLPPAIRPLASTMKVAGRAMPVLMADVHGPQQVPFGRLTEALDQLQQHDVYLCAGGAMRSAYWGEILTATARANAAAGAVIDGYHRDTPKLLDQEWPVFSRGSYGQDSGVRTRVIDYRVPVEIAGVSVTPGDLVFGDLDGVVVVPRAVEDEVLERALEKAAAENVVRQAIERGMSSTEALRTYGVL